MEKPIRPPNAPWLSAYLIVKDADKSLEWYARAFGFKKREAMAGPDGKTQHAEMTHHEALIMFAPEGACGATAKSPATLGIESPVGLYVYVEDVDALFKQAVAAGATVRKEPQDMFWGDRMCSVIDPDGHSWSFGTWLGKKAE